MRKRARTVLCGGRSAMVVPTASIEDDWHGVNIVLGTYGGLLRTEHLSIQMYLQRKSVKPSRPLYGEYVRWLATAVKVPDASVNTLCVAQYTLCCFYRRTPGEFLIPPVECS